MAVREMYYTMLWHESDSRSRAGSVGTVLAASVGPFCALPVVAQRPRNDTSATLWLEISTSVSILKNSDRGRLLVRWHHRAELQASI